MVLSNYLQFNLLFFSLIGGFITGVSFDIYRAIRGNQIENKIIIFVEDTLFWVLISIIVFIFLFYKDGAIINTYSYAFIIIGIYIYFKFFSSKLIIFEIRLFDIISRNLRITFNIIMYPFRLVINHFFPNEKNK